jgi:hypothetical protein
MKNQDALCEHYFDSVVLHVSQEFLQTFVHLQNLMPVTEMLMMFIQF